MKDEDRPGPAGPVHWLWITSVLLHRFVSIAGWVVGRVEGADAWIRG